MIVHHFLFRSEADSEVDVQRLSSAARCSNLVAGHRRERLLTDSRRFQKRVSLSMRSLTCRMNCAAVPATPSRCGT